MGKTTGRKKTTLGQKTQKTQKTTDQAHQVQHLEDAPQIQIQHLDAQHQQDEELEKNGEWAKLLQDDLGKYDLNLDEMIALQKSKELRSKVKDLNERIVQMTVKTETGEMDGSDSQNL